MGGPLTSAGAQGIGGGRSGSQGKASAPRELHAEQKPGRAPAWDARGMAVRLTQSHRRSHRLVAAPRRGDLAVPAFPTTHAAHPHVLLDHPGCVCPDRTRLYLRSRNLGIAGIRWKRPFPSRR